MKIKFLKQKKRKQTLMVPAYSMTEILIVLCIIGILLLMILPNQVSVISQAKSIEAQSMLTQVFGLQKSHFYRHSKYSSSLEALGFEQEVTVEEGGQAVYRIEIVEASNDAFLARATAVSDLDGDGIFNVWEIDHKRILREVTME